MALCTVRKRGQCIAYISCTRSILRHVFCCGEAHGDVDAADHQDSFLGFNLPGYVSRQSSVAGINLARFQRASKCAQHSTGGDRNDVVQG